MIDLGADLYHLEMLRDPDGGTLTVWVLDGEMEQFVRIAQPTIGLVVNGRSFSLKAVANTATGETVGDTSQFELRGDWVKGTPAFKAQIGPATVRGTNFPAVSFQFPDGS